MAMTTADLPGAEPEPTPKATKAKVAEKTGLADAAASTDPAVVKLMWDRAHRLDDDHPESAAAVARIDAQLREHGFDL